MAGDPATELATAKELSARQTNNESLFREKPPLELVNIVLKSMGFESGIIDTRPFTKDDLREENMDEWLPELEAYYIPCKARRFLDSLTRDKFVTIIRHILSVHNFDLRTQERVICGLKKTQYRIEPNTPSFSARSQSNVLIEFN